MARKQERTHWVVQQSTVGRGRWAKWAVVELATGKTVTTRSTKKEAEKARRFVERTMRADRGKDPAAMQAAGYVWSDFLGWVSVPA